MLGSFILQDKNMYGRVGALNMANNASLISIPGYVADATWDNFRIDGEEDLPAGFI